MGHPNRTGLVRLGDELIENAQLLGYIATSVMEQLPVNINQLFKAPPRTMARAGSVASPRSLASEQSYFEALGSSTWKVRTSMPFPACFQSSYWLLLFPSVLYLENPTRGGVYPRFWVVIYSKTMESCIATFFVKHYSN